MDEFAMKKVKEYECKERVQKDYAWDVPSDQRTVASYENWENDADFIASNAESIKSRIKSIIKNIDEHGPDYYIIKPMIADAFKEMHEIERYMRDLENELMELEDLAWKESN